MMHFARTLSHYYQGLEPVDPPPSYNHERSSLESIDIHAHDNMPFPSLKHLFSMRETSPYEDPTRVKPVQVTFRMTGSQIRQIHATAQREIRERDPKAFLSRQDVLAALVVYSLSHAEEDIPPIQNITSLLMVRSFYWMNPLNTYLTL